MFWRTLVAGVAAGALTLPFAPVATATVPTAAYQGPVQLGWWYKSSGTVQVVADANHVWGEGYDNQGQYLGRLFNYWWDWYCQVGPIASGDNQGTPFRLWAVSPLGSGVSCLPNNGGWETYWTVYYGWHNGAGGSSGANVYHPGYVAETGVAVPFRSPAELGTLVEIW